MSKRSKDNEKTKKRKIIIISALAVVAIAVIIGIVIAVFNNNSSRTDTYVDEEGNTVTKITDKDGNETEYYTDSEGNNVTRVRESISGNGEDGESEEKIIESYVDADGNQVIKTLLPDGTVVTEIVKPNGDSSQTVDVPKTPLTTYISYGDTSSNKELKTPDVTELDYFSIKGYAPMYSSDENGNTVFGMQLPYSIGDTGLVIESIGSFNGPYVEDGSDEEIENVAAMIITNTSDKMVQYSSLNFDVKRGKNLNFVITNLPANTSVMVLETNRIAFSGTETVSYKDDTTAFMERDLHSSEVSVLASDNLISLTNNTDKTIDTAYVYYKIYVEGGAFLGGITYRAKLEDIAPGETLTQGSSHYFIDSSQVLTIDIAYEQ